MKAFLQQVAEHYFREGSLDTTLFVFPNRRSSVFFKKYFASCAAASGRTVLCPGMMSISDLFHTACGYRKTDKLRLLLILYECYRKLYPGAESLDQFVYWGDVLLSDFGDVDRYMADPRMLFTNVAEFKGMRDDCSYMTAGQLEAVKRLLRDGDAGSRYKGRFLDIWNILYPLYTDFRKALESEGLSYEGMVYRKLAESLSSRPARDIFREAFPYTERFVFVGLNTLNECEKRVLGRLRDASMAEFCWDYSSDWIRAAHNASSFFMKDNLSSFPQAFTPDAEEPLGTPSFTAVSVASSVGQAKLLPQILGPCRGSGMDTAVVLPDEGLLMPVLHSIPPDWKDVNVTMGYPISLSEMHSLLSVIAQAQLHTRSKEDGIYFHFKEVSEVLSNSVLRFAVGEEGLSRISDLRSEASYYVSAGRLGECGPLFASVFTPVVPDASELSMDRCKKLSEWMEGLLDVLADVLDGAPEMDLEAQFARRCRCSVNVLGTFLSTPVLPSTWFSLLLQMTAVEAVPFEGEPLKGLQVMGPLETRALDFRRLVILSCNEGMFPRHPVSASFIPPELRRAFSLPTYEHQDAMWAYYFYRMIQRADEVWMLFDSREGGLRSGEQSRYLRQLELDFGVNVRHLEARSSIGQARGVQDIAKSDRDMELIRGMHYSASSIQDYLSCQLKFYYGSVRRLRPEDEIVDSMDAGMVGSALHEAMNVLMLKAPDGVVTASWLQGIMDDDALVRSTVRAAVRSQLKTSFEIGGRNLVYEDIIRRYVLQILLRDRQRLEESGKSSLRILEMERTRWWNLGPYRFKGMIDRLDCYGDDDIRVVDYKTGKVEREDVEITDETAQAVVDKLFGPDSVGRPKIALQLFLYDRFIEDDFPGRRKFNSIYGAAGLFVDPIRDVEVSGKFSAMVSARLRELLDGISDQSEPFRAPKDDGPCEYCDFKMLCGR